jgi:hypothetical protein
MESIQLNEAVIPLLPITFEPDTVIYSFPRSIKFNVINYIVLTRPAKQWFLIIDNYSAYGTFTLPKSGLAVFTPEITIVEDDIEIQPTINGLPYYRSLTNMYIAVTSGGKPVVHYNTEIVPDSRSNITRFAPFVPNEIPLWYGNGSIRCGKYNGGNNGKI